MHVIQQPEHLPDSPRKVCLAIGVFDGVHLGHQQVIRQAITDASHYEAHSVVVTFDKHPNAIVAPHSVPSSIYSQEQKLESIRELGAESTLVIPFDKPFSQVPGEQFIKDLHEQFGQIRSVCVGRDFTFGHRRSGNVDLLEHIGESLGFKVHGLAAVALDGEVVSSTRIREAITDGQLDRATQMLGRDYKLSGQVIRGDGIGRQLTYPTANLDITGLQTPPNGVYSVHAFRGSTQLRGVANIGVRPTVRGNTPELRLEVHFLEFDDSLYDERIDVQFLKYIRSEMRFESLDDLKQQISVDVQQARAEF